GEVELLLREDGEGGGGQGLEIRHGDGRGAVRRGEHDAERGVEGLRGDVVAADADPLRHGDEVGRGVEARAQAGGRRDRGERGRGRSLAVGPGHANSRPPPLRPPRAPGDRVDRGEAEPDAALAEGLEPLEIRERPYATHSSRRQRPSVAFISERSTMKSSIPCSSRNSERWKPSGSVWRI